MATAQKEDIELTLMLAAKRGELEDVEKLLAAGTSPLVDEDGNTAIAAAAAAGHHKVVKRLLDAGAEDLCVDGWTAGCKAAFWGKVAVLEVLIDKLGADLVASPSGTTMTPLLYACLKGHKECAKLLLDAVPTALTARDSYGRTAVMLAASGGKADMIKFLVTERGAPLDETSSDGKTALMWAVSAHQAAAVSALVQLGASLEGRTAPDPHAAIIPGKDNTKGETVHELVNSTGRDPTQRFVSAYLENYAKHLKESPGVPMAPMEPFPHVSHAEAFVVKETAEAAAAAAAAAAEASAAAPAKKAADESDIFGAEDVPSGSPAPAKSSMLIEEVSSDADAVPLAEPPAAKVAAVAAAAADLDALD